MNREQQLSLIDNEQTKIELQSQADRLNMLERRIEELEGLKNLSSQFLELQREMAGWSRQYAESLDQIRWKKADQDKKIEELILASSVNRQDLQSQREHLGTYRDNIEMFRLDALKNASIMADLIEVKTKKVKEECLSKIKELESNLVVSPAQILENNNEIKNRVEIAMLDSNNAILKSTNLETLFKVLDRRLENLTQLIKKIELGMSS